MISRNKKAKLKIWALRDKKTRKNCPVERVAEDTAGGAEEAGAQGETSPFFINFHFQKTE